MVREPGTWVPDPRQYVEHRSPNDRRSQSDDNAADPLDSIGGISDVHREQLEDTGVLWRAVDISQIRPSDVERARYRFRASLPDLVWNAAKLEGNTFTLPEVRTLLDGVTVGGHRLDDAQQILALSEAYSELDEMVGAGTFSPTKAVSDGLHAIVARHEALDAGRFRGEGSTRGGGTVSLSNGGQVPGTPHGEGGVLLRQRFEALAERLDEIGDPRERALVYFAAATRAQFYFDGNKRTARLMMTGVLLDNGYDAINIPYARRLEFNNALDRLFESNDATELIAFLASCAARD